MIQVAETDSTATKKLTSLTDRTNSSRALPVPRNNMKSRRAVQSEIENESC